MSISIASAATNSTSANRPRRYLSNCRPASSHPEVSLCEDSARILAMVHLDGDTDLIGVVASLLREEARRAEEGRADATIPMRPDHGQLLIDDIGKKVNPG